MVQAEEAEVLAFVGVASRAVAVKEQRFFAAEGERVLEEAVLAVGGEADEAEAVPGVPAVRADDGGELAAVFSLGAVGIGMHHGDEGLGAGDGGELGRIVAAGTTTLETRWARIAAVSAPSVATRGLSPASLKAATSCS